MNIEYRGINNIKIFENGIVMPRIVALIVKFYSKLLPEAKRYNDSWTEYTVYCPSCRTRKFNYCVEGEIQFIIFRAF